MINMFGDGSGLSIFNYNQLLIGWAVKSQTRHVRFNAGHSTYNGAANAAHNTLRVKDAWTIVDGGLTTRKATSQITRAPHIAPITYGRIITSANLIDGAAGTRGRFYLTRSPLALSAGTHRLTVIFRPAQTAYYATVTTSVLVRVNPRHLTLGLTGLATTPHGQSVTVTVVHLIAGANVTVAVRLSGSAATYTYRIATAARVNVALSLPTAGMYSVSASASRTNYVFAGATGLVTAT